MNLNQIRVALATRKKKPSTRNVVQKQIILQYDRSLVNNRKIQQDWVSYNKNGKYQNISMYPTVGLSKWYFVIHGLQDGYKNGIYLGKMYIPDNYPAVSPKYIFLTPNGYFAINNPIEFDTKSWNTLGRTFMKGMQHIKQLMLSLDPEKKTTRYVCRESKRKMLADMSIEFNSERYGPEFKQCFPEIKLKTIKII